MGSCYPAIKTLTLALLISAVAAAPTPLPQSPASGAMNAKLNFLVGTWHCTEPVRGRIRPSTQTYRWSGDGRWLIMTESAPPFDPYRKIVNVMEVRYTFDAAKNRWVELTNDNTGYYGVSYAAPFKDNRLVTRDVLNKNNQLTQDVLFRVSDAKTTDTFSGINFKMKPDVVTCIKK